MKHGFLAMLATGNYGRFMNGGYQIAAILGIAKKNSLEPVFNPWTNADHRDRFGSAEDVDLGKYFVHQLPPIPPGIQFQPERFIDWGWHPVDLPSGNWNLAGHFQAWRYYDDVRDQLSHYFRMIDEPPQNEYCALHIRMQDYEPITGSELPYHPRLPLSYYRAAIRQFPKSQKFLVFSDDIEAAKVMLWPEAHIRMMEGSGEIEFSEGRDYIQDFKLLKTCASFIIGNSSYSAMAAILGDHPQKKVIAPRPWFGPIAGITAEDLYEPSWTVIDWA